MYCQKFYIQPNARDPEQLVKNCLDIGIHNPHLTMKLKDLNLSQLYNNLLTKICDPVVNIENVVKKDIKNSEYPLCYTYD